MIILSEDEIFVRDRLNKIYPQLLINSRKVCGSGFDKWGGDLLSLSILFFLEKPIEQQLSTIDEGKLENFITYIMKVQLLSSTSKFYNDYRRSSINSRLLLDDFHYGDKYMEEMGLFPEEEEAAEAVVIKCIECELEKLDVFQKMLVKEKLIGRRTFTSISEQYGINYDSLKKGTNKIIKKIKSKCRPLEIN